MGLNGQMEGGVGERDRSAMGPGSNGHVFQPGFKSFTNKESRVWFSEQLKEV